MICDTDAMIAACAMEELLTDNPKDFDLCDRFTAARLPRVAGRFNARNRMRILPVAEQRLNVVPAGYLKRRSAA